MARTKAGLGPQQTAQVIFMIEPKIAGEVEAWRVKRGVRIKSTQYREIFLAGLAALVPGWEEQHGRPSRAAVKRAVEAAPSGRAVGDDVVPVKRAPRKASGKSTKASATAA